MVFQRMGRYTTKSKSNQWTRVIFSYLLDTARVNAQTICALNRGWEPRKSKSFEFGIYLAKSLVLPLIERRPMKSIKVSIQAKMALMLKQQVGKVGYGPSASTATALEDAKQSMTKHPNTLEKEKRCQMCLNALPSQGHKQAKDRLGRVKAACGSCVNPVCGEHKIILCESCSHIFTPLQAEN